MSSLSDLAFNETRKRGTVRRTQTQALTQNTNTNSRNTNSANAQPTPKPHIQYANTQTQATKQKHTQAQNNKHTTRNHKKQPRAFCWPYAHFGAIDFVRRRCSGFASWSGATRTLPSAGEGSALAIRSARDPRDPRGIRGIDFLGVLSLTVVHPFFGEAQDGWMRYKNYW